MSKRNEIYKCNVCGNIVEMVHVGGGQLVCCNHPMNLQNEKQEDVGGEKHVPVVEVNGDEITVSVGSVEHPMQEDHFIEFVEVISQDKVFRKYLSPSSAPKATFKIDGVADKVREYCTIHGLWSAKID